MKRKIPHCVSGYDGLANWREHSALYGCSRGPISRALARRGVDVRTAQEDGTTQLPDDELLDRATALNRALFTRDDDLLAEAKKRQQAGRFFAGIIYAHQLRVTIGRCISDLEIIAKANEPADLHNRVEHLPLR